jgi:TPR repeat protein
MKPFQLAAEHNLAEAQVAAGICFFLGIGCCVDLTEAEESFKMAAYQDDAMGAFNYGIVLSQYSKSTRELFEASKCFRFAADHDSAFSQVNYGIYLLITRDARKDQTEAARYLKAAADKHDISRYIEHDQLRPLFVRQKRDSIQSIKSSQILRICCGQEAFFW